MFTNTFHRPILCRRHSTLHRAFSLAELIITLTVFAIVAVLCAKVLAQSLASAKKIQAQAYLYSEAQNLMDQLTREVERNTLDYEAYYLRYKGETGWETQNYGFYAQAFYNPGTGDPSTATGPYSGIDGYGVLCADGVGYYPDACSDEIPNYDYLDFDTGAHPFEDIDAYTGYTDDPSFMNALCESNDGLVDCNALEYSLLDQLILINGAGDERTIFARELFDSSSTEYRLSKVELSGTDQDNDGIVDAWECLPDYTCNAVNPVYGSALPYGGTVPDETDLENTDDPQEDFMPLSPDTLNIESFTVYLSPLEDPYRAFAEEDVQVQPQVTLVLTARLSEDYGSSLLGNVPSITIQRTVSTGVYAEVLSYE